jgi:uncharacterized YkwD family protein
MKRKHSQFTSILLAFTIAGALMTPASARAPETSALSDRFQCLQNILQIFCPDFEFPRPELPDAEEPGTDVPDVEEPDIEEPDVEVPGVEEPDTEEPDVEVPDVEVPDVEVPDVDEPDIEEPDVDEPDPEFPDIEIPAPEEPEIPDVEEPDTEVPGDSASVSTLERQVVELVNQERVSYGLAPLTLNVQLCDGARLKSQDMHDNRYFDHNSPTYGTPYDMMASLGITYASAGENIAMGYATAEAVVNAWMNSPGHRANILSENFTEIGVGHVADGNYWTQWFIG